MTTAHSIQFLLICSILQIQPIHLSIKPVYRWIHSTLCLRATMLDSRRNCFTTSGFFPYFFFLQETATSSINLHLTTVFLSFSSCHNHSNGNISCHWMCVTIVQTSLLLLICTHNDEIGLLEFKSVRVWQRNHIYINNMYMKHNITSIMILKCLNINCGLVTDI